MRTLIFALVVSWASIEVSCKNAFSLGSDQTVVTSTKLGGLKGTILTSRGGHEYYAFLGVPFAEKTERFQAAQPVKPWEGVRDSTKISSICPQRSVALGPGGDVIGDEDCLYLNVFTPAQERCQNETTNLPVLFHIHGGGFTSGSGDYFDPLFFMDECIVYVSINYRLGALGFITTQDGVLPGNLGLKDALLALKWTNQHIENFRGDKNSITITGISAGGISVSHFLASPAAKGLFQRVIAQSGSSLTPFIQKDPKKNAIKLGELVGCTNEDSVALKSCLESKTIKELISNQDKLKTWVIDLERLVPVVEPEDAIEPFQTEDPYLRIKRGEGSRVPLITGVTKDEGILLNAYVTLNTKPALEELNNKWYEIAPIIYLYDHLNMTDEERNGISDKIKNFYLGGKPVGPETSQGFIDSESDRNFNFGSWEEASLHSKYAPVYHYSLNFKGNYSNVFQYLGLREVAVSHGHDTQFFYKTPDAPLPEPGSDRLRFSENVIKLWTSFIKTGVPTDVYPNVHTWENFNPQHPSTLILDLPAENAKDYKLERMKFWSNLNLRKLEFPGV